MTGLDTNILVRYVTQDDPDQSPAAGKFIEKNCSAQSPGFINHIVLCELIWVLKRCYKAENNQALQVIGQILRTVQLQVQEPQIVWKALRLAQKGRADFADYMIGQINLAQECETTLTFDKAAAETGATSLLETS